MKVAAAIHDLMFSSKVNAAAQGRAIAWVPRGADVAEHVKKDRPDVLLLDLGARTFDALAAARAIKADPDTKDVTIIGFIDHVQEDRMAAAQAAGVDRVMSRGEFARRLPELLRE